MPSTTLDYHHDSISLQVVEALASEIGTDANELEPLYYVVDPEALDQLFQSDSNAPVRVEFEYDGRLVEIRHDGTIAIDGTIHERG